MIDTAKFSARTGLTENSARVIWNKLRQKLVAQSSGEGVPVTPKITKEAGRAKKTPASKRKNGVEDETGGSPLKKPRKPKQKKQKAAANENVQDDGEDAVEDEDTGMDEDKLKDEEAA